MESFLRSRRGGECEKGAPLPVIYDSGEHQSFFSGQNRSLFHSYIVIVGGTLRRRCAVKKTSSEQTLFGGRLSSDGEKGQEGR